MKEASLYPYVEDFLRSEAFGCFRTATRVGTSFVGIADVVGVRDVGGDVRGDVEIIAVEVKKIHKQLWQDSWSSPWLFAFCT
jgi:hypothetical protein